MATRVIFLDIDGVLIPIGHKPSNMANSRCIEQLNRITDSTKAKIVISSSWRHNGFEKTVLALRAWGVTGDIIGRTGADRETRVMEILEWLATNFSKGINTYVVIDDEESAMPVKNLLVKTDEGTGLSLTDADRAIAILRGIDPL